MSTDDKAVVSDSLPDDSPENSIPIIKKSLLNDVNFEDLIVTSATTLPNNTYSRKTIEKISTTTTTATPTSTTTTTATKTIIATKTITNNQPENNGTVKPSTSLIKIAPKPISGTIQKNPTTGQFVLIQSKNGTPVRISANPISNSTATSSLNKQTAIQVIRTSDGSLVPIKTNKSINLSNVSIGGKKILATNSTGGATFILKNTSGAINTNSITQSKQVIVNSVTGTKTSVIQTISVSDVQKAKLQKILPATTSASTTTNTITAQKILLNSGDKVDGSSSSSNNTQKSTINAQIIKIAQASGISSNNSSGGTIQTIQLPNKGGGYKYVRVLNPGASLNAKESTTSSSSKMTLLRQSDSSVKLINKLNQQQSSKLNTNSLLKEDCIRTLPKLSTIPTLRKINDEAIKSSLLASIKREPLDTTTTTTTATATATTTSTVTAATSPTTKAVATTTTKSIASILAQRQKSPQFKQLGKPRLLNSFGGVGSSSFHDYHRRPSSKGQFVVVSQELFRSMKFSPKKGLAQARLAHQAQPKKLYSTLKPSTEDIDESVHSNNSTATPKRSPSPEGGIRRKHCNCTKSQCLKLYCDCFANGEFCQNCNCKECFNNLDYEDERQKAIKMCLERNPAAFKPKITKSRDQTDTRLHNKGCNCKRSGCLKNYCECYEAKIACSSNCKCLGCRNVEDRSGMDLSDVVKIAKNFGRGVAPKRPFEHTEPKINLIPPIASHKVINEDTLLQPVNKQPYNFITQDVVDATIQCMIAQADECQKSVITTKQTERMILEELGRCLVEIIDFSIRNIDN